MLKYPLCEEETLRPDDGESSVFHNVMSYLVFTQCTQAECETALLRQTLFMSSL